MLKLRKTTPGAPLIVSMASLRLADRVLIIGCGESKTIALLSTKPGLTGRVCLVDDDAGRTARGAAVAEGEGALVETETAPLTALPFDAAGFDVVIVNHLLTRLGAERRSDVMREALRMARPGGRCLIIESGRRSGLAGLLGGGTTMTAEEAQAVMQAAGFLGARVLAERDGLLFIEGARRNETA